MPLGMVLHDLEDLTGARTQPEQALTISEQTLGPTHPGVATYGSDLDGLTALEGSGELPPDAGITAGNHVPPPKEQ